MKCINATPNKGEARNHYIPISQSLENLKSSSPPLPLQNPFNQVCRVNRVGEDFFICFESVQGSCPQVLAGRVLASAEEPLANADPTAPPRRAVIFGEGHEAAGRPAVDEDDINGAEARVLTVSEWVDLHGECDGSSLSAWYTAEDEEVG